MSPQAERLSALEQRVAAHEERCEERLAEIRAVSASTLKAVEGLRNRAWAVSVALLAWALAQLWSANAERLGRLEADGAGRAHLVAASERLPAEMR